MWLVFINYETTFEFAHNKPPPSYSIPTSCFSTPYIFARCFESSDHIYKMLVYTSKKYSYEILACNYGINSMLYLLAYN
jgi:hypothetical protein